MLTRILSRLRGTRVDSSVLLQQADAAHLRGDLEQSRGLCETVLRDAPDSFQAHRLMAAIAADDGKTADCLRWAESASRLDPSAPAPHYLSGRVLQDAGRLPQAEASYRRVLQLQPGHARAHNNLGAVLHMQGNLDAALAQYRKALDLDPGQPQANQNYATIVRDGDALERAAMGFLRHTQANPRDAVAYTDLGNTWRELGKHKEALDAYDQALRIAPELAEAHFSRSFVRLLLGDYAAGWSDYEWRWRIPTFNAPARRFAQPIWDGRDVPSGVILLHAEQGLGDTLQFARYAPLVAGRCAKVVLECQMELLDLMRVVPGVGEVVAQGAALPAFAAHAPLMSLPHIFGTTLQTIPWSGPYVHADSRAVAQWRVATGADKGLKVGLVWAGRPQQWDDRKRSIALAMLAPLASEGVVFYSLQIGAAAAQAASPPPGMRLIDLTARIRDFGDTAALVSLLDLVITIDTSVAHLAGAMGIPTWILTAHSPDWRYHLQRSDHPWYPSVRLFRQERDGDWSGAIAAAATELSRLVARG